MRFLASSLLVGVLCLTNTVVSQSMPKVDAATLANAKEASAGVEKLLTRLRGLSPTFYSQLLTSLQIYFCDIKSGEDNHATSAEANAIFEKDDKDYLPYMRYLRQRYICILLMER